MAKRDVRTASWLVYKSIDKQFPGEFPVGGLICTMHRHIEENKSNDVNDDTQLAPNPDFSSQTSASPCNAERILTALLKQPLTSVQSSFK